MKLDTNLHNLVTQYFEAVSKNDLAEVHRLTHVGQIHIQEHKQASSLVAAMTWDTIINIFDLDS